MTRDDVEGGSRYRSDKNGLSRNSKHHHLHGVLVIGKDMAGKYGWGIGVVMGRPGGLGMASFVLFGIRVKMRGRPLPTIIHRIKREDIGYNR